MAFFLVVISFFVPEIHCVFKFSYYANVVTDGIISCAKTQWWDKIKNISTNNEAMLLKLGRDVGTYEISQWYTFWCCYSNKPHSSLLPLHYNIIVCIVLFLSNKIIYHKHIPPSSFKQIESSTPERNWQVPNFLSKRDSLFAVADPGFELKLRGGGGLVLALLAFLCSVIYYLK